MKTIVTFQDEISGFDFDSPEKALKSEEISRFVQDYFHWVPDFGKEDSLAFANGEWSVQWTEKGFSNLLIAILDEAKRVPQKYLTHWSGLRQCVCPTCFRVYGQPYFAINCQHEKSKIPTRELK